MTVARKAVAISLAMLGAYYAILGSFTLLNLPDVTRRWIQLSGDPDFRFDVGLFTMWIGFGAAIVVLLGLATAACGIGTAIGRTWGARYWIGLAIAAPLIHFPWFMYRVIATGTRPRAEAALGIRAFAIRCAAICAVYALAWVLTRRQCVDRLAG